MVRCVQDKRHQMMNDVRALCDAPHVPGLVDFVGAYHESENGQVDFVMPAGSCSPSLSGLKAAKETSCHDRSQQCCSCRLPSCWSTWMVGLLEMSFRRQVPAVYLPSS